MFSDQSEAFDCVSHDLLLSKLQFYGFNGRSLGLLQSYLSNRLQQFRENGRQLDLLNITAGVPRGSSLGPSLILICINNLPRALPHDIHSICYADETTLQVQDVTLDRVLLRCREAQVIAEAWFAAHKLALNKGKTVFILSSTRDLSSYEKNTASVSFLVVTLRPESVVGLPKGILDLEACHLC